MISRAEYLIAAYSIGRPGPERAAKIEPKYSLNVALSLFCFCLVNVPSVYQDIPLMSAVKSQIPLGITFNEIYENLVRFQDYSRPYYFVVTGGGLQGSSAHDI